MKSTLSYFRNYDNFLLVTHIGPDGDAIGSQLGLGLFLEKLNKQVTMLNSDPVPPSLEWLPGAEKIQSFDETSFNQRKALAEAEVIVILDTNAQERLGDMGESIRNSGAHRILIDHHTNPEMWFDDSFVRDTASATAELLVELIEAINPDLVDKHIATALYTGIMTDTGSFRYSSVTPHTHRMVAKLLEYGELDPDDIHTAMFDNRSLSSVRLLSRALAGIKLRYDGQVAYTVVTNDMFEATGADSDDKKGIVSYVLSIEGVRAALIFSEAAGGTKVSFRSQGDAAVNEWAGKFGGGGHRKASGAFLQKPLTEAIDEVIEAAPTFLDLKGYSDWDDGTLTSEDASYLETMMNMRS